MAFTNAEVKKLGGEYVDCNDDNDADDVIEDDDFSNAFLAAAFCWDTSEGDNDGIEEEGDIVDKDDDDKDATFLNISTYGLVDRTGDMYKSDSQ